MFIIIFALGLISGAFPVNAENYQDIQPHRPMEELIKEMTAQEKLAAIKKWEMMREKKPPSFSKYEVILIGKICNLDGKPLHTGLKLTSKKNRYERPSSEAGYTTNKYGEYYFGIPTQYLPDYFTLKLVSYQFGEIIKTFDIKESDIVIHKDIMVEEIPRTRPWWHFKYNTGKCDAPWAF